MSTIIVIGRPFIEPVNLSALGEWKPEIASGEMLKKLV